MLIDTHCHIDQFPSPEGIVGECERSGLRVVAVTNLPSHYAMAADRLRGRTFVSAALGLHPLCATEGVRELAAFKRMAPHANFIGEIGLDFSHQGVASRSLQEQLLTEVLASIKDRPRFISLHSRGAEKAVLNALRRHGIGSAVFHWFTGSETVLEELLSEGHFISVNPAMLRSQTGQRVLAKAPRDRILVETDAPFTRIEGRTCQPQDVVVVYQALAGQWKVSLQEVVDSVSATFRQVGGTSR